MPPSPADPLSILFPELASVDSLPLLPSWSIGQIHRFVRFHLGSNVRSQAPLQTLRLSHPFLGATSDQILCSKDQKTSKRMKALGQGKRKVWQSAAKRRFENRSPSKKQKQRAERGIEPLVSSIRCRQAAECYHTRKKRITTFPHSHKFLNSKCFQLKSWFLSNNLSEIFCRIFANPFQIFFVIAQQNWPQIFTQYSEIPGACLCVSQFPSIPLETDSAFPTHPILDWIDTHVLSIDSPKNSCHMRPVW